MQIQVFSIPTHSNEVQLEEMNRFLRGHQIIDIERTLVTGDGAAYWTFCVRYLVSNTDSSTKKQMKSKIDYKEVLDEKDFKVFAKLREIRKDLATENGIPVYAVFTNKELADIACLEEINLANVQSITGIGEKKLKRYGKTLLERYQKIMA